MRDASLIPLTHDHHHALAACRSLRLAAEQSETERLLGAQAFLEFFSSDAIAHFREEEELLFPLVIDEADAEATLSRVMLEHLRLHAAVRSLSTEVGTAAPSPGTMSHVAELLKRHVMFEEKVVFPLIELRAGEEGLRQLSLAARDRTAPVLSLH